jgi:ABC-type dipeptide/oligopeptide/nickel transport system permease component
MPPILQFILRRVIALFLSLIIITMLLYAGVMMTPAEVRVSLYYRPGAKSLTEEQIAHITQLYIERYHLNDPYPVQYAIWVKSLVEGNWGYSPTLKAEVLPELLRRTSATAELTLYSLLIFIPLGLAAGVVSGWNQRKGVDNTFRLAAFIGTSFPPFILSLLLIAIFYVGLGWFSPFRLDMSLSLKLESQKFVQYTGMYTIDGLLNHRWDVSLNALRHLVLPVITLSLYHWATLGRITRSVIIAERRKDYVVAARARGAREGMIMWKHAFRNTLAPSFTSLVLSAASLVTGVFVVEMIYSYGGVSDLVVKSLSNIPDPAAALGFSVYSVLIVLVLMFIIDILLAVFDPRVREEVIES